MKEIVDTYRYCNSDDNSKREFYNHKQTLKEKKKTKKFKEKINKYIEDLSGKEKIVGKINHPEKNIKYYERTGYISLVNETQDKVDVFYYGLDEEEAYYNAIIGFEISLNKAIEAYYRDILSSDYKYRFRNQNNFYQSSFYIAELSLQDLKYYFKDQIPTYILDYFNNYIYECVGEDYIYDIEKNSIVEKSKQKIKKKEENK